jgi:hypothetical protein
MQLPEKRPAFQLPRQVKSLSSSIVAAAAYGPTPAKKKAQIKSQLVRTNKATRRSDGRKSIKRNVRSVGAVSR